MAKPVSFIVKMLDQVTGPASRVTRSLRDVENQIDKTTGRASGMGGMIGRALRLAISPTAGLARALMGVGSSAAGLGLAGRMAHGLMGALNGVKNAAIGIPGLLAAIASAGLTKKIIDDMSFKEQSLISFKVMLGDTKKAADFFEKIAKFADVTPFETAPVVDGAKALLAAGYGTKEIFDTVLVNAGDLASAMGKPLDQAVVAFQALKGGDFGQAFGVGQGFNQLGITRKMLEGEGLKFDKGGSYKGSIEEGLAAVNKIIKTKFGGMMAEQSASIGGLFSTLASRPANLFYSLTPTNDELTADPKKFAGFNNLKASLQRIAAVTDPGTAIGKKLVDRLRDFLNRALGKVFFQVANFFEPTAFAANMDKVIGFLDRVVAWWATNGPGIVAFAMGVGQGIGEAFSMIGAAWKAVEPFVGGLAKWIGDMLGVGKAGDTSAQQVGRLVGMAIILGGAFLMVAGPVFSVIGFFAGLAGSIIQVGSLLMFLNTLTGGGVVTAFTKVGPAIGTFVGWLGRVVPILGPIGGVLMRAGGLLMSLGRIAIVAGAEWAASMLSAGMASATAMAIAIGPIGWLLIAIAAVGIALVLAYNNCAWFRDSVNQVWLEMKAGASDLMGAFAELPALFGSIGTNIMLSLSNSLTAGATWVRDAAYNAANTAVTAARDALGIHSPSKVFAHMGLMVTRGFEGGVGKGQGMVTNAVAGLGAAAAITMAGAPVMAAPAFEPSGGAPMAAPATQGPMAPGRAGGSGAAGASVSITVQVDMGSGGAGGKGSGSAATPEQVGQAVADKTAETLVDLFERMAAEDSQ